ncbi:TonB-dependent receptor [Caulobacter sp. S45]|uniref:TonB-dependent receptor n=1 Tax=Caulobacter sp. S45 TaxID=1641861 RepID=UPI00131BE1AC|nr:TonB-dependent receptor [Caulobacter sp. S45]
MSRTIFGSASALALAAATACTPAYASDLDVPTTVSPVVVTQSRTGTDQAPFPGASVTLDAQQARETTNVSTVEDLLKYLPDVMIRQRHVGDTQDPITTRTSGVGESARSLVYVDGVLVSALIGNNNTNASPRWGLTSPESVDRIEVMYGPYSAAFPGNSIGEVVQITTRMPEHFEAQASVEGAWQDFDHFSTHETFPTGRVSGSVGDRIGAFSFRLSAQHLDTEGQPLFDVTAPLAGTPGSGGTPVAGAIATINRTGAPVALLGVGGLEHQTEDNLNLKLGYDISPSLSAAYTVGFFRNLDNAVDQSYLRNASGAQVFAGALNIAGLPTTVPASAFSNDRYHLEEDHLAQSFALNSHTGGVFDWSLTASTYDYLKDRQRMPTGALPGANAGGPGTITSLDGTGWYTLDAQGVWRPQGGLLGANRISFGVHQDRFQLENPKYNTANWVDGGAGATATLGKGKTQTNALWTQDDIRLASLLTLTVGGRYEHFDAYDGLNANLASNQSVKQPGLSHDAFSPKAVLAFTPRPDWRFTASIGRAYRFPTVEELYQAITTGPLVTIPNPNLKPEDAVSEELSAQRTWPKAMLRLSLFEEHVDNALLSQSGTLPGQTGLFSFVQNVGRTRAQGAELVGEERDVGLPGVEVSGWITYVDSQIQADSGFPAAVGKQIPQLPRLRGAATATWRPTQKISFTASGRYSDRSFGTIDNSDHVADTFTGFGSYFVMDLHARYVIDPHLTGDVGVDNLTDRSYYLFHPFPQRTVVAELTYRY